MPENTEIANKVWHRYEWCRDNGHEAYVKKAIQCDNFFCGKQWRQEDIDRLEAVRRPALTINKIISTVSTVLGEQIYNRAEIGYRPRSGAPAQIAEALTKVFKQISDNNQLDWKRSDMFADGIITSRGYLDARLDFNDSMMGEVKIEHLNPKNVIPDPDADQYDPDTWSDVLVSKWYSADEIAVLYNKADAELLRGKAAQLGSYDADMLTQYRDRFGERYATAKTPTHHDESAVERSIRVIERQHRQLDNQRHFVDLRTGDMRPVPESWDRNRIALVREKLGWEVVSKLVQRIRWTVVADTIVLHDAWSEYKHFTVIPYFPYFRSGRTIGLVENLLGPQELLNKVSSQELHVVNTTANSGWKVKTGSLKNMSPEELEQKGAQTGLVMELEDPKDAEKIQPNQIPTGLERISYKAEEHIKTISNVSDSMQGFDREDVAAKAIQTKRQAGGVNLAKPMDSLIRTDFLLARNVLDLVQRFYTEERILTITHDQITGETEDVTINEVTAEGEIVNDLTIGEYDAVVSSVPVRETLEDSQFEQAVALRELGVSIPDTVLIDSSRLQRKREILQQMQEQASTPEAQQQAALANAAAEAEIQKTHAEISQKQADAQLKAAKAEKEGVNAAKEAATPIETEQGDAKAEMELERARLQHEMDMDERRMQHEINLAERKFELEQRQAQNKARLEAQAAADKRVQERANAVMTRNNQGEAQ